METRDLFDHRELVNFSTSLLHQSGLPKDRAETVSEILVEADLMGHQTHGLQLLPLYLDELRNGTMATTGEPEVLNDSGAAIHWNGDYLPGPWLLRQGIEVCLSRINDHPVVTHVIQRCHHIACLAAYLEPITKNGLMVLLSCSDPATKTVAPFGGHSAVYSPNPIAAGLPTEGEPILIDISMSTTANGIIAQCRDENKKLTHPYILDNQGNISDDPARFFSEPPGTVLPLGGLETGYKGFALGMLVEALTSALGGYGRSDNPENWGASVFLQIIDPAAFGGQDYFRKEMQNFVDASLQSTATDPQRPVRMPGARALKLKREQLVTGVGLSPTILKSLGKLSEQHGVGAPRPLQSSS